MNILLLNWRDPKHPNAGGAEIVTLGHAKGWVVRGHRVTWFCPRFAESLPYETIDGVNVVRGGGFFTVYVVAVAYYITHRRTIDIVIDQIHFTPFLTPLYVRKPIVAFIHEMAGKIWDYTVPFPFNVLGKAYERTYLFFYRNVLFWTDAHATARELASHGISRSHIKIIPCPVSNEILVTLPKKQQTPTFLYVSRLVKMKGIEDIITAFSFILPKLPRASLWIVGEGNPNYEAYIKSLVATYGMQKSVVFFGRLSDKEKLYRMRVSHILLHVSVKEGWGLVVLEAASQGTPSIVYNVPGLVEVVKNGETGTILSDNNPKELATQALSLLRNKTRYRNFQKNGLRWIKSITWSKAIQKSLHLLQLARGAAD